MINRQFGVFGVQDVNGPVGMASLRDAVYIAWDDTRNGSPDNEASDVYFTRIRFGRADELVAGGADDAPAGLGMVAGVLLGLAAAGAMLLIGVAVLRRRKVHGAGADVS